MDHKGHQYLEGRVVIESTHEEVPCYEIKPLGIPDFGEVYCEFLKQKLESRDVSFIAEKRQGWKSAVDVFGDLIETGVVEAIKLGPEISFRDAQDFKFVDPEGSLAGGKERLKIKDKGFVGFAGLEEICVDLGNFAGITSHLFIIFVYEYDLI